MIDEVFTADIERRFVSLDGRAAIHCRPHAYGARTKLHPLFDSCACAV
jgi:hypothetical protein